MDTRNVAPAAVLLTLFLVAIQAPGLAAEAGPPPIDLRAVRMIDLTHPFDDKTIYWPNAPSNFQFNRLSFGKTEAGFFYAANAFCTDPDYRLTVEDVRAWEAKHGPIPTGAIVLLLTGWGKHWPDRKRYLGDDKPGDTSNLHFPSYGADATRLLIEQRKADALGVDTASIDHGPSKDFIVHQIAGAVLYGTVAVTARLALSKIRHASGSTRRPPELAGKGGPPHGNRAPGAVTRTTVSLSAILLCQIEMQSSEVFRSVGSTQRPWCPKRGDRNENQSQSFDRVLPGARSADHSGGASWGCRRG